MDGFRVARPLLCRRLLVDLGEFAPKDLLLVDMELSEELSGLPFSVDKDTVLVYS